jgi:hypothetical protein
MLLINRIFATRKIGCRLDGSVLLIKMERNVSLSVFTLAWVPSQTSGDVAHGCQSSADALH